MLLLFLLPEMKVLGALLIALGPGADAGSLNRFSARIVAIYG